MAGMCVFWFIAIYALATSQAQRMRSLKPIHHGMSVSLLFPTVPPIVTASAVKCVAVFPGGASAAKDD